MIQQDLAALHARFLTAFSPNDPQVSWLGKPTSNPDESKPYCRFVIEPGASGLIENGLRKSYLQTGLLTFTVTVPKGTGTGEAYDLRDKFVSLFREWRSADGALVIGGYDRSTSPTFQDTITEGDTSLSVRCRVYWESIRTA